MRVVSPPKAYFLSIVLTALTTWLLLLAQTYVSRAEGGHVRPFGVGFLLTVALLTIVGGRGPGLVTLLLSGLSLIFYLTPLGSGGVSGRPRDIVELLLLVSVGGALVRGLESLRGNALLLAESEEARARLRAVMDTAPVGVLLSDLSGTFLYANSEAERLWGQTLKSVQEDGGPRYKIFTIDGAAITPEQTGLRRALAGERALIQQERIIEQADGTRLTVDAGSTVVRDAAGRARSGLVIFSDITERKRAEEEVQRLLARERLINQIGQITLQTLDQERIQSEATTGLIRLLAADSAFFRLHDGDAALHTPGMTLVVSDAAEVSPGSPMQSMLALEQIKSAIITPLFDADRLVATLTVAMSDTPRSWKPEEVSLVEAVAAQTRAAVEAARTQARERTIAVVLQDALIPTLPKRVPGLVMASYYKAALAEANVGGDFLDVFALEEGQAVFTVGDLSGKGLAAAAQVATLRNMLRYSLYRTSTLEQAVTELNHTVVTHDLLSGFATLFVGRYNQQTRGLTYLSCGHDPGLLRRRSGGRVERLPGSDAEINPVLGLADTSPFFQQTVTLDPGDTLFFCTDGVTEAGRARGEFLGVDGVAALLQAGSAGETAEDLIARIVAGVREHAQGDLHDDVCLLAAIVGE